MAATLPGFGGTLPPDDLSMESYAAQASKLAADFRCVAFGQHDDIGLTESERCALEVYPAVSLVTIPDASHFALNQQPGQVADLVLRVTSNTTPT